MEQIGIDKIWEENYAYQTKVSQNPNLYKVFYILRVRLT